MRRKKRQYWRNYIVLTGVQRHRGCESIQLPHDCIWFYSSGESRSNTKLLQFSWVTTQRSRPHVWTHIYNFAGMWARAAGVCCMYFSEELYSAHWAVPMLNAKHHTARHTCCGSMMSVHFSSFTCSKNPTASHTKSSGTSFKVTLSTLLCTRLPTGRQVGKWAVSNVSVPLQDRHYTSLTHLA